MTVSYLEPDLAEALLKRQGFFVRDRNALLSALAAPLPVFEVEVYPSIYEKAAALLLAFNANHPMLDGNKRSSWLLTNTFLYLNAIEAVATIDERYDMILDVANKRIGQEEVTAWFRNHAQPV